MTKVGRTSVGSTSVSKRAFQCFARVPPGSTWTTRPCAGPRIKPQGSVSGITGTPSSWAIASWNFTRRHGGVRSIGSPW